MRSCFASRSQSVESEDTLVGDRTPPSSQNARPSTRHHRPVSRYPLVIAERKHGGEPDSTVTVKRQVPISSITVITSIDSAILLMFRNDTTRTTRALMRQQFRAHPESSEKAFRDVAAFFGRSLQAVRAALFNFERDDIENDGAYVEGIVGEVINVDLLPDADTNGGGDGAGQREEKAAIEHIDLSNDAYEIDQEDDPMDSEETTSEKGEAIGIRKTTITRRQIEVVDGRKSHKAPPLSSTLRRYREVITEISRFTQDHDVDNSRELPEERPTPSPSVNPQSEHRRAAEDDLTTFLSSAGCVHLADRFRAVGISTKEAIDKLSVLSREYRMCLKIELDTLGSEQISFFDWLLVEAALNERVAALRSSNGT
ncbi:hypothetical protein NM688_g720 [Phlebia brevispora]|uniref:Uncharacterized protein n=1 Tax=Phlebia brevispora TaxID=194682 RepID=A0ACC1TEB2_9APHY|nr:hypothetical protein NM688_g720 [Phlebia brevispora]